MLTTRILTRGSYALKATDDVLFLDATDGDVTIRLGEADLGRIVYVSRIDSTDNLALIASPDSVNGAEHITTLQWDLNTVISSDSSWRSSTGTDLTDFLKRNGDNTVTAEIDWDGNTIKDFGGCTSSNAATLPMISNVPDGSNVIAIKQVWDVVADVPISEQDAVVARLQSWGHTKTDASYQEDFYMAASYRPFFATQSGRAFLLRRNEDLGNVGGGGYLGFVEDTAGHEGKFTGFRTLGGTFVVLNRNITVASFVSSGLQIGAASTPARIDTTNGRDLRMEIRGANLVNGDLLQIQRRSPVTIAAGQRLLHAQENITGPGLVDRFSIWSDNAAGEGGIGIPFDQKLSFDDSATRGNTWLKYLSGSTELECTIDGLQVWTATAAGLFVCQAATASVMGLATAAQITKLDGVETAATADPTAMHTDVASEISGMTVKGTPAGGDFLVIEDSAASNVKKHVLVSTLPAGTPAADSITNVELANMVQATVKGRASFVGTGDPVDLTPAQLRTIANVEDDSTADQTAAEIEAIVSHDNLQSIQADEHVPSGDAETLANKNLIATTNRLRLYHGLTVELPDASENITWFFTDRAITVIQVRGVLVDSGVVSVTYQILHDTDRSAAGTSVTNSLVHASGGDGKTIGIDSVLNDTTIPANSWVWLVTTASATPPASLALFMEYTED